MTKRTRHAAASKVQVALEALKDTQAVAELAARFEVPPTLIHQGTRALLEGASGLFEGGTANTAPEVDYETVRELHARIGEVAVAKCFYRERSNPGARPEAQHARETWPPCRGRGFWLSCQARYGSSCTAWPRTILMNRQGMNHSRPAPNGKKDWLASTARTVAAAAIARRR